MKIVSLKNIKTKPTSHNNVGEKKQMIAYKEIPHLAQFAQAVIRPGEVVEEHVHKDLYEIFFVEEGNGIIKIDGKEHTIKKGMSITVEPNELHEVRNSGNNGLVLTYFAVIV